MTVRSGLTAVYVIVFLAFFDTFALLPTVGPYAASLGAGAATIGLAIGSYSASNIVFNIIGGMLLDRVGRRAMVASGLFVAIIGVASYAFATTPEELILARLIHGAGGGLVLPALFALAGDLARVGHRGAAMGRIGAFIGLAAVVGPTVAGPLRAATGFASVFLTVALVLTLALVLTTVWAVEMPAARRITPTQRDLNESDAGGKVVRRRQLVLAIAAVFGFTSAFATLAGFLGIHVEPMARSVAVTGGLFALVSGIAAVIMVTPLARWVDRAGVVPPVVTGMAAFVAATVTLATTTTLVWTVVACMVFGVGFGVLFPAATGGAAASVGSAKRGRAFGWFNAAYSLGFVVGAPAAGAMADMTGVSYFITPAVTCTIVAGATCVVALRHPQDRNHHLERLP